MNKKIITAILASCLISITACGNQNIVNDEISSESEDNIITPSPNNIIDDTSTNTTTVSENIEADKKIITTPERNEVNIDVIGDTSDSNNVSQNHDDIAYLWEKRALILEDSDLDSFEKTKKVNEINSQIIDLNCYDFSNTRILFIGDSITAGNGGNLDENGNTISYANYACELLNAPFSNYSIPGSCLGHTAGYEGMVYRLNTIENDLKNNPDLKFDMVILFGGFNDYNTGAYFGDSDCVEGSFTYDCKHLFDQIDYKIPGDIPVYIITCYRNIPEETKGINDIEFSQYLSFERQMAKVYGYKVIELHAVNFMNNNNQQVYDYFFSDDIHPNDLGYRVLGAYVAAEIVADYN